MLTRWLYLSHQRHKKLVGVIFPHTNPPAQCIRPAYKVASPLNAKTASTSNIVGLHHGCRGLLEYKEGGMFPPTKERKSCAGQINSWLTKYVSEEKLVKIPSKREQLKWFVHPGFTSLCVGKAAMQECHIAAVLVVCVMEERLVVEAGWTHHLKKPKIVLESHPGQTAVQFPSRDYLLGENILQDLSHARGSSLQPPGKPSLVPHRPDPAGKRTVLQQLSD